MEDSADKDAEQELSRAKQNAFILSAAQAIIGSAAPIAISTGGLAGYYLLAADKSLATAPVTGFNLGVALGAMPAALLMRAIGRRLGFIGGALVTLIGGLIAFLALMNSNFWLFAAALVLIGMGGAFSQQYRFAAADAAPSAFKPVAISWVLGGGVFAAIIGPQTVIQTSHLFSPIAFAGAYLGMMVLAVIGMVVLAFLNKTDPVGTLAIAEDGNARPLSVILWTPKFLTGLICGVSSAALMSFVMTGAPLAMIAAGCTANDSTLGISWHVMAMFAPSFFTGRLIAHFGKPIIIASGLLLLTLSATIGLSGDTVWHFWIALIVLGLGWNFGFIGSTALVAEAYTQSEKNKVQGFHDMVLFGFVAFASLMSGFVFNAFDWAALNLIVYPVVAIALSCLLFYQWKYKPTHAAS